MKTFPSLLRWNGHPKLLPDKGFFVFAGLVFVITGGMVWGLHHFVFRGSMRERAQLELSQLDGDLEEYVHRTGHSPSAEAGLSALLEVLPDGTRLRRSLPVDPWGRPYQYVVSATPSGRRANLFSKGPDAADPADDIVRACMSYEP